MRSSDSCLSWPRPVLTTFVSDHFDAKVEESLRRSLPIITTPHAKEHLTGKGSDESFSQVYDLDFFQSMFVDVAQSSSTARVPAIKVTGMPGQHVPDGVLSALNHLLSAVPPTNGWMLELGYKESGGSDESFKNGYRYVALLPLFCHFEGIEDGECLRAAGSTSRATRSWSTN